MSLENILYFGVEYPLPELVPLRAGPITLFFGTGDLRYIRCRDREIIRRIYAAVRDHHWDTINPNISKLAINQLERAFQISFTAHCLQDEIDFRWHGEIIGTEDGAIRFLMDGQARSEFWRNRIGFCVLHPLDGCAGKTCEVETIHEGWQTGVFPRFIAPHQPFKNVSAIRHEIAPGISAEVRMQGDTFEMEDQRNWTDASFKTYCTPLELPLPVRVKVGDRVKQEVQLRLSGKRTKIPERIATPDEIEIAVYPENQTLIPHLGLGIASHRQPVTRGEIQRLKALNFSHLRVDLYLEEDSWAPIFEQAVAQARLLGTALEIGLHLPADPADTLREVRNLIGLMKPAVSRWLLFSQKGISTPVEWVELAGEILGSGDGAIPVGFGADSNFAELNRMLADSPLLPAASPPDFLVYAANPQVHARDHYSLVENLAGLGETVRSAHRLGKGRQVVVSPVTLRPRFNAAATGPDRQTAPGQLPAAVDPRQMSLFGAGWTLGAFKYLAENGIHSATFYETTGWQGVMETEGGSPLPGEFRSIPGAVFPMYHILADIGEYAGGQVFRSASSNPLMVDALLLSLGNKRSVLAANFTPEAVGVHFRDLPKQVRVRTLDETNVLDAMQNPLKYRQRGGNVLHSRQGCLNLDLNPCAAARIDFLGEN